MHFITTPSCPIPPGKALTGRAKTCQHIVIHNEYYHIATSTCSFHGCDGPANDLVIKKTYSPSAGLKWNYVCSEKLISLCASENVRYNIYTFLLGIARIVVYRKFLVRSHASVPSLSVHRAVNGYEARILPSK